MPKRRPSPQRAPLTLGVPAGEPSLAYGELSERLAGEGQRARFREVESARVTAQAAYRKAVYIDRETGRFASKSTWKRSRAHGGERYVRHYRDVPAREAIVSRLPKAKPGTFDTLDQAAKAAPDLKLGRTLAGKDLDARLQALGVGPVRVRLQGFFQRTAGGKLERWEASTKAAGGLDRSALASLLNAATRTWQGKMRSPPVILVNAVTVDPTEGEGPGQLPAAHEDEDEDEEENEE